MAEHPLKTLQEMDPELMKHLQDSDEIGRAHV
jgi:hypothetical protein